MVALTNNKRVMKGEKERLRFFFYPRVYFNKRREPAKNNNSAAHLFLGINCALLTHLHADRERRGRKESDMLAIAGSVPAPDVKGALVPFFPTKSRTI